MTELETIRKKVKKVLDKYRYQHTLGVMYTAASLAMCYGENLSDAMLAGLLHDCAKCIPDEEKLRMCKAHQIELTNTELQNTALIHPKLGAFLAKEEYGIEKKDILDAVASHTTGHPNMTTLEKIIFIADYIEPGRTTAPNLSEIRALAFQDLDLTMLRILEDTLNYLREKDITIDSMTEETFHFYKQWLKK